MQATTHCIHGIRDNGERTTARLAALLSREGMEAHAHRLPRTRTWHAASNRDTRLLARSVIAHIEPGDHLVCHSHGCNVGWAIMQELALTSSRPYISNVVFLAPAMHRRQRFGEVHFDRLLCIHNPVDFAIWMGSALPCHPFGMAGALGFKTADSRVRNEAILSFVGPFNHTSPYFQEPYIEDVAARIARFLA